MKKEKALPAEFSHPLLEPVAEIALNKIACKSDRVVDGSGDLTQLTASIGEIGLISPIVLTKDMGLDSYHVVAGRRRFDAAKTLGWPSIPAFVIKGAFTEHATEIALAENVNRLDMHPLDEAAAFKRLEDSGMAIKDIARYYARSVSGIYQRLRLCDLIDEIQGYLRDGKLSLAQAALLASLNAEQQQAFCDQYGKSKQLPLFYIESFLHNVQHNTLCGIAVEGCATCKKRTWHTDATLFPEFSDLNDVCFDDVCYRRTWTETLAGKIADELRDGKGPVGRYLIRNNRIDELFGKDVQSINLDGVEYTLLDLADYRQGVAEPELWAWQLMPWGDSWELGRNGLSRKGADEGEAGGEVKRFNDNFDADIDLAGASDPEERQQAEKALRETYKTHSDLSDHILPAVFGKLIAIGGDLCREKLDQAFLEKMKNARRFREVFTAYTGHDPSDKTVAALTEHKMLCVLMVAFLSPWDLPRLSEVEAGEVKSSNPYVKLFGLKLNAFIQLYKDTMAEALESAMKAKPETADEDEDEDEDAEA